MEDRREEKIRGQWDALAGGFDDLVTPMAMPLAEEALSRAGLRAGMGLLDVAAGSGALSIPAARRGAEVLATDISPRMVDRLRARARSEGLGNLEARVMDGCALELEDGRFDIAGSQNGVSLFPDLKQGLAELVRVTKPGGRVVIVAFGPLPDTEFLTVFLESLQVAVPGFAGPEAPPLPFQLADPEVLRRELEGAGLGTVEVDMIPWRMEFRSAEHFWHSMLSSNPVAGGLVAKLTPEQVSAVRDVLTGMLRERVRSSGSAVLTNPMNVGIGTK